MKIVFVALAVENLAIEYISSYLKSFGHEVEIVFDPRLFATEAFSFKRLEKAFDITEEMVEEIAEKNPDVVGFSVFSFNYQRSLSLARKIKARRPGQIIVFGGVHPTCVPEVVIKEPGVDIVCVGEGEEALRELLGSLNGRPQTKIRNLWFKKGKRIIRNPCRPLIADLDRLPLPDKDLFFQVYPGFIKDDYYTASSRGCPFACTYCANNALRRIYQGLGKPVRRRSPENLVDELVWAKKNYGIRQITFVDDVFVEDVSWLRVFAKLYKKKVGLPYVMITHPLFMKREIVRLLVGSGCYFLLFGIQSASEETRKKILKRFESNADIEKAAETCHEFKLKFSVDHIFNIPGEEVKEQEEALKFYNRLRPSIINSYWLQYFPGTEIIKTAEKFGILNQKTVEKINQGRTSTSLVVGLGNKDTINPRFFYTNFQFFFMLLPVLPKFFTDFVVSRKLYLKFKSPPIILNIFLKSLINLSQRRGSVYWGIIKSTVFFMKRNLRLKWQFRDER